MATATLAETNGKAKKAPAAAPAAPAAPELPAMLASRIPTAVGDYVYRSLAKEKSKTGQVNNITDIHVLALTDAHNRKPETARKRNIMLLGPTGTGKTELVSEYAARTKKPLITVMPAMRPEHLIGQFIEDADGKLVFQRGPLWIACELGNSVLYFDEINRLHEDVVPILYPLLDRRRQLLVYEHGIKAVRRSTGEYLPRFDPADPDQEQWEGELIVQLPDDVLIVASYNPGYAGTNQLNEALRNRFEVSLVMDYSDEVEAKVIKCDAIRKLGKTLRDTALTGGVITSPITTNQLRAFEENVHIYGLNLAVTMFLAYFESDDERTIVRQTLETKYLPQIRTHFSYPAR